MPTPSPDSIRTAFRLRFGEDPTVVVRAPGRVNLIGEHTDYSGLPVLPIAIDRALLIAAGPGPEGMVEAASGAFEGDAALDRQHPNAGVSAPWHRYLAGALTEITAAAPGTGARILVDGDLPGEGGLSSSSALTCGLLEALNHAWAAGLDREAIVQRAIVAERHVGVETGGMDQEVIVFAEAGTALRIDFDPPARRAVPLPPGLALVVAYSGEAAPKGTSARDSYNERVVGARIAAAMLADSVGLDIGAPPRLCEVADVDVVDILVDELPERMSPQEAAHGAGVELERLVQLTADRFDTRTKVPVKRLARHILAEAVRVDEAEAALRANDLAAFGRLLNESHNSLREDFRCSTPALDRICAAMRKAGAFGARLTGAGFGGFAVAACAPASVAAVIAAAEAATGGPAFEVRASGGLSLL
ncbi:MAG: hypothetical protein HY875_15995 [Chloroflexi bacterium]|nr:hypothetical protein [Chloroflexota bacterium]